MFNKKYSCLVIIFIIAFVAISAVAASDNATDSLSIDKNDEISLDENIGDDNENNALSAGSTFNDLNDTINGNGDLVINLTQDYAFDSNVDGAFKNGIIINRDLTINGNGHEINAYGKANIFNVVGTNNVVFKNISFVKSFGSGNGAVSGGTSINCNFTDCASLSKEGGAAIYKGTAINCTFSKNMVMGGGSGGAIYQGNAVNCTFLNNAGNDGGAMYGGTAVGCIFIENQATRGGAIFKTTAQNCNFTSNLVQFGTGGAASQSNCFNCMFTLNSASGGGAGEDGRYYGCTFIANTATRSAPGGALFNPIVAVNCTFINNSAVLGSAIYDGVAIVCIFINNTCDEGTQIYDSLTIDANDFECIYNAGEVFNFRLTAGTIEVDFLKTNFAVYKLNGTEEQLINDFYIVSGEGWIVDLEPGFYKIKLSIDDFPQVGVKNVSLNVLKIPTALELNVTNISMIPNGVGYVLATLKDYNNTPLANVNLAVGLNGTSFKTDSKGQVVIPIGPFTDGTYNINISYCGDEYYNESGAVVKVDVNKLLTEFFSDCSVWISYNTTSYTFDVVLKDINNKVLCGVDVTVNIDGDSKNYTTDENGTIKLATNALMPGTHNVTLNFKGNDVYINSSKTYTLHIEKLSAQLYGNLIREFNLENLTANDLIVTLKYLDSDIFDLLPLADAEVIVKFNGVNNTYITDKNGTIRIPTNGLRIGNYTALISFNGTEIYKAINFNASVRIIKAVSQIYFPIYPFDAHYGRGEVFKVQLRDANGNPIRGINTITVSLNGERNYTTFENGTVFISSNDASLGTHWANIIFRGNENYTNSSHFLIVNVYQGDPILSDNNLTTTYNSDENLIITLTDSVGNPMSGWNLTCDLNGIRNYTTDEKGLIYVSVKGIAAGNYSAKITFEGDFIYAKTSLIANFTINKAPMYVFGSNMNLWYGDEGLFNITLMDSNYNPLSGNYKVNFDLNGRIHGYTFSQNYTTDKNGTISILIKDLMADSYLVTMTFYGNENFTNKTNYQTILIKKLFTELYSKDLITTYGESENLVVTLKDNFERPIAGLNITVNFNGIKNYTSDENGKIYVPINEIAVGNHTLNITFKANDYYWESGLIVNVTVNKADTMLSASYLETKYGADSWFNITLTSNGKPLGGLNTVYVQLDENATGKNYITDENGTIKILTRDMSAGYYWVKMTYFGNENYAGSTNYQRLKITKADTVLSSDNIITHYNSGENLIVTLKDVFGKALSNLTVSVNLYGEKDYVTDINGSIKIPTMGLAPSDYLVFVKFRENVNFTESSLIAIISITKDNTSINVNEVIDENNVKLTVDVNPNATGLVKFEINGPENYVSYSEIVNGRAISYYVLAEGNYTVNVEYDGDSYFNSNSTSKSLKVIGHIKKNTTISSNAVVDGCTVTITTVLNSNATGNVTLGISNQTFIVPINNGRAVFTYDFTPKNYIAEITYLGDYNFNTNSTSVSFTVEDSSGDLKNTTVLLDVLSVENNVSIIVKVNQTATGLVEIKILNSTVYIPLNNGEALYEVVLAGGKYNVTATYLGDAKFNPNSTTETFTVYDHVKMNTTISNNVVINGNEVTVTVNLDCNATGFVEYAIIGKKHYAPVNDGKAVLSYNFLAGTYAGYANYLGDENFNPASTIVFFTVEGQNITLKDTFVDVIVNTSENNVSIMVKVNESASGLVELKIGDDAVYVPVNNGEAICEFVLAGGKYNVTATYMGDGNFNPNSTAESFIVFNHIKLNTTINCDVLINETTVSITANLNNGAGGFIEFIISGKKYYAPVNGGKAVFVSDFFTGTYAGNVNYLGDENFNPAGTIVYFTVIQQNRTLDNTSVDVVVYTIYNDIGVIVNVNVNATGLVEFVIGDEVVYVPVNNGVAVYSTSLAAGNHTVYVTYLGDFKFNPNATSKQFTVFDHIKQNTTITSDVVVSGNNVNIAVNINPNASGVVIFKINNLNISVNVKDGKAVLNYIFDSGKYDITATYMGDDEFNANTTQIPFTVKFETQITAYKVTTTYGTGKYLILTLTDANGELLAGKNITVNLDGKNYNGVTDVLGGFGIFVGNNLAPKTYVAFIVFDGDDMYVKSTKSVEVVVAKATSKITAKKKTFKKSIKTKKYSITLKAGKKPIGNVKVTLKIKGKTYTAKTNAKGKATFKIKKLTKKGKYKPVIKFKGNTYYKACSKKVNISIK